MQSRIPQYVRRWINSHVDWKHNRLMCAGGLEDQPARWVTAMKILDSVEAEVAIENNKK